MCKFRQFCSKSQWTSTINDKWLKPGVDDVTKGDFSNEVHSYKAICQYLSKTLVFSYPVFFIMKHYKVKFIFLNYFRAFQVFLFYLRLLLFNFTSWFKELFFYGKEIALSLTCCLEVIWHDKIWSYRLIYNTVVGGAS